MDGRRLARFVVLNVVVSIIVTLVVLSIWESTRRPAAAPAATSAPSAQTTRPPEPSPTASSASTPLPAGTPEPTATATPSGPFVYIVQSGDTLGGISLEFDVALADLLAANSLAEDALLSVGQAITIPLPGSAPTAAGAAAATTVAPEATAAPALVVIREIESPGAVDQEAVILTNLGEVINLTGWSLSDGEGKRYLFPQVTLFAGAELRLHTRAGVNSPSNLYWGESEAVWGAPGIKAYLRNASGILIAEYRVP